MALSDLLTALRDQAEERRAAVLAEADEAAEDIRARAGAELERRRRDHVARVRAEEEDAGRRAVVLARTDAAASVFTSRDRLLERVRSALARRIANASTDSEYEVVMTRELREALLGRLPDGPVTVRVPVALASAARGVVDARARHRDVVVEVSPDVGTGFTATATDEGVELDATLEARLEQAWPRLAVHVLRELQS